MNPVKVIINRDFDLYRQRCWERTEQEALWKQIRNRAAWAVTLLSGAVALYFIVR